MRKFTYPGGEFRNTLRVKFVSLVLWALLPGGTALALSARAPAEFHLQDGDRVVLLGGTFIEQDRHLGHIERMLRSRFLGRRFSVRNLAWPGDTTQVQMRPLNFGSMERHIRGQSPTVIFVSYGMSESFEGQAGLISYLDGYRRILDMLAKIGARIVMISPIRHERTHPPLPDATEHNRNLELYVEATRKLAQERGHRFVDLFHTIISAGNPESSPLTTNGIHLSEYGYWRASEMLAEQLGLRSSRWQLQVNADGEVIQSVGARVTQADRSGQSLRFKARDTVLPHPAPASSSVAARWATVSNSDGRVLTIEGLESGRYALKVDGRPITTATAEQWARGVALKEGPAWDQACSLQEHINQRDRLFFYRWRAHNAEYIYGRRSTTRSGKIFEPKFPAEMQEFDRLIQLAD
ncbi:SGNH/GDSL hydrolase family protein, partial [Acidobacteria bacterium AH-259-A15]|nr:SGNH/GDSL hydrolase family protein [Acidobacteria bacterium AH-259-A15]